MRINHRGHSHFRELHSGPYGSYLEGRTLAYRAMSQGYFWLYTVREATKYWRKSVRYQKCDNLTHQLVKDLHMISSPWSFMLWGLDIIGPLAKGIAILRHIFVAMGCFSTWLEVKVFINVEAKDVIKFVKHNIIYYFGIPTALIIGNGCNSTMPNFASCVMSTTFWCVLSQEAIP